MEEKQTGRRRRRSRELSPPVEPKCRKKEPTPTPLHTAPQLPITSSSSSNTTRRAVGGVTQQSNNVGAFKKNVAFGKFVPNKKSNLKKGTMGKKGGFRNNVGKYVYKDNKHDHSSVQQKAKIVKQNKKSYIYESPVSDDDDSDKFDKRIIVTPPQSPSSTASSPTSTVPNHDVSDDDDDANNDDDNTLPQIHRIRHRVRPRRLNPYPTINKNNYKLFHYKKRYVEKYGLYEDIFKVKFANRLQGTSLIDLQQELLELFSDVIRHLNRIYEEQDRVRVYINHPGLLYSKPIFIALRPLGDLNANAIMQAVEKVLNSNQALSLDKFFTIHVGIMGNRHAGGRVKLVTAPDVVLKRSIIEMVPLDNDHTCVTRAILVGVTKIREPNNDNLKRKSRVHSLQGKALDLLYTLGIDSNRDLEFQELYKIEDYLNIQVVIFSKPFNSNCIYVGAIERRDKVFLYYHANHCDLIGSITSFLSKAYYCNFCLVPYTKMNEHACDRHCNVCCKDNCLMTDNIIECIVCNFECRNQECFDRHKTKNPKTHFSVCESYWRCPKCKHICCSNQKKDHLCGSRICRFCSESVIGVHKCYVKPLEPKQTSGKFLYYDFECTQEEIIVCSAGYEPLDDPNCQTCLNAETLCGTCSNCKNCSDRLCGKNMHSVNFVVAQTVCNACHKNDLDAHSTCVECGSRCRSCDKRDGEGFYKSPPCKTEGSTCGKRERVFKGIGTAHRFGEWLFTRAHKNFTCIAHNAKAYDNVFLLEYLVNQTHSAISTIYTGTKITTITVPEYNIRLLDSLCFFPFSLRKVAQTFNLNVQKGDFPHLFNIMKYFTYDEDEYPDKKYYGFNEMSPEAQTEFLKWYTPKQYTRFNFQEEMLKYCRSDVVILRLACTKFRNMIMEITETSNQPSINVSDTAIDPFINVTIAGLCQTIFRTLFLREHSEQREKEDVEDVECNDDVHNDVDDTSPSPTAGEGEVSTSSTASQQKNGDFINTAIGIVPTGGYTRQDNFSKKSILWLSLTAKRNGIHIRHALNGGEYRVPETNFRVDGFSEVGNNKTIWEYFGCYFHGCPECTGKSKRQATSWGVDDISFTQRYAMTIDRKMKLIEMGYKVECIWEHECDIQFRLLPQNEKDYLEGLDFVDRLCMRDSFFGGRTNAIRLYAEADEQTTIKYYDVTSLYPFINKGSEYPLGHPTIITSNFKDVSEYFGIALVKVTPPNDLFFPVLPYRCCGKLKFPLCARCADLELLDSCTCTREQRSWVGTYCTVELQKALLKGYEFKVYEVYHWDKTTKYDTVSKKGGLFTSYVNTFLKIKTEASGFPVNCVTDADKITYVKDFYEHENVQLDIDKIEKNPPLRALAKLMLNSFWGRWGMRESLDQTTICRTPKEFFEIIDNKTYNVTDFHIINDETVSVIYSHKDSYTPANPTISVVLASFTTAYARLLLLDYLEQLDRRVLYHDTDSIIYTANPQRPDLDLPLGNFLGDLTDEIDSGRQITHFVSTGPKSYAYRLDDESEICKIRGFSLTYQASRLLNFTTMKDMIKNNNKVPLQGDPSKLKTIYTVKKGKINRSKNDFVIYNHTEVKAFRPIYTKRVVQMNDLSTLPYGYLRKT